MERDVSHAALDAIAFVTGATLSAMLGIIQWRVDRATGKASGYLLLWLLAFIWTFGSFLRCTLELAGATPDSLGARIAESFAWSCTILGPLAVGRLLQSGIGETRPVSRWFFAVSVAVSALNLAMFVRACLRYDLHVESSAYPTTSFFVALLVMVIALALYAIYRRSADAESRKPAPHWFAPAAIVLGVGHTLAILLGLLRPGILDDLRPVAELVARHWTIPWSVLIAVALAQVHYADVVLKRSLWLLASATLATLASIHVFDVAPGLPQLGAALGTALLMLVAPYLIGWLDTLVDRVILDRPDHTRAIELLENAFRRATDPEQVVDAALGSVRETLRLDVRLSDERDDPVPGALASVTVASTEQVRHRMDVIASHRARTLLQRELDFLGAVGTRLGQRLDAIHFEQEQRALHLREERLKRLLTEAELKALRTQVDPHFLFNTLNTIAELISTNPQQAERMTERLAECFRYVLSKHARDLSTLDEELEFARQYLGIEQVRFGERLDVRLSRGDARGTESVPSLLLQPLLENAIRHGLASVREGGCVSVTAHLEGARLRLCVEDDGVGLRPGFTDRAGVGLRNVQERLRALYSQAAEFLIGARPGGRGTAVTIVLPLVVPATEPMHAH